MLKFYGTWMTPVYTTLRANERQEPCQIETDCESLEHCPPRTLFLGGRPRGA